MRACVILIGAAAVAVEVPGVPLDVRPVHGGSAWVQVRNDSLSGDAGNRTDDLRTQALAAGWRSERWTLAIDHAVLTDRYGRQRCDELTATAGLRRRGDGWSLAGGPGLRAAGDLGGAHLQRGWHRMTAIRPLEDSYEGGGASPLAWGLGEADAALPLPWWLSPWSCEADLTLRCHAAGLATMRGEVQGSAGVDAAWAGAQGRIFSGIRWQFREGPALSRTAATVAERERGPWWVVGTGAGAFGYWTALHLDSGNASGGIDAQLDPEPRRGGCATVRHWWLLDWAGSDPNVQLRWQRPPAADARFWRRSLSMYSDWRSGTVYGPSRQWQDAKLEFRQLSFGVDAEALPSADGTPQSRATRGVLTAAVGVRGVVSAGDGAYGLAIALRTWRPMAEAGVDNPDGSGGTQRDTYQRPGTVLTVGLLVLAPW